MRQKYVITSDCRIENKHVAKGETLDLDADIPGEAQKLALLNLAGRVGLATKENVAAIQAEIKADSERDKRAERFGERFGRASSTVPA